MSLHSPQYQLTEERCLSYLKTVVMDQQKSLPSYYTYTFLSIKPEYIDVTEGQTIHLYL